MIRIIDEKDSGKTKKLIEEASKNNGILVCKNAYSIKTKAVAYGFYSGIKKIMTYEDFILNGLDKDDENVYIDELEDFMNCYMYSKNLVRNWGYSMSKEV